MSEQYSPSVARALAGAHRELAVAQSDTPVPHPASAVAAQLVPTVPRPAFAMPPHEPDSRREIFESLVHEQDDWDLQRVGLSRAALLAGQTLDHAAQPDAIDSALVRIDAIDERAMRYRNAIGGQRRLNEPGVPLSCKIEPSLIDEIDVLARQRGEKRSETMRWLIKCGLVLADERRKRYEAFILNQMRERVESMDGTNEEKQAALVAMQPERYLDPASPSIEHAMRDVDPFGGAPPEVRKVAEDPFATTGPAANGEAKPKGGWY